MAMMATPKLLTVSRLSVTPEFDALNDWIWPLDALHYLDYWAI